jgi:hypothetical protein
MNMDRAMDQAVSCQPLTTDARVRFRGHSMWDLRWINWHFGFSLSLSFHQCSIILKNEKKIIFIAGLHNKSQGCGASI